LRRCDEVDSDKAAQPRHGPRDQQRKILDLAAQRVGAINHVDFDATKSKVAVFIDIDVLMIDGQHLRAQGTT
jgi:hypothetical protein